MLFSRRKDRVNYARRLVEVEDDEMEIEEDKTKVCVSK